MADSGDRPDPALALCLLGANCSLNSRGGQRRSGSGADQRHRSRVANQPTKAQNRFNTADPGTTHDDSENCISR